MAGDSNLFEQTTLAPTEESYLKSLEHKIIDDRIIRIVSFYLDDDEYAVDIGDVVRVVKPREFTEIPHVPAFIKGVISVRGEMVPVMDVKKRLGIGFMDYSSGYRILIVTYDGIKMGLFVDRMGWVLDVPASLFEEIRHKRVKPSRKFLKGIIFLFGRPVYLLRTDKLFDMRDSRKER